jgi:hypothetical protein
MLACREKAHKTVALAVFSAFGIAFKIFAANKRMRAPWIFDLCKNP